MRRIIALWASPRKSRPRVPFSIHDSHEQARPWLIPQNANRFEPSTPPAPAAGRHRRARTGRARRRRRPISTTSTPSSAQAVETLDGPVLVLAGAGTGKTRVLTTRIAHILATGRARPSEILAVTFTNKAAREMKERVGTMIGQAVEGMPWLGTFHAIGVKILRRHAELVGLKSDFTILDIDDQIRLLKQLLRGRGHRREALAGARAGRADRPLEEPRADARPGAGRRSRGLRQRPRQEALPGVPGAAEGAERRRLRRPAAGVHPAVPREPGGAARSTSSASSTSWSTSTRTPTWRSISGCG